MTSCPAQPCADNDNNHHQQNYISGLRQGTTPTTPAQCKAVAPHVFHSARQVFLATNIQNKLSSGRCRQWLQDTTTMCSCISKAQCSSPRSQTSTVDTKPVSQPLPLGCVNHTTEGFWRPVPQGSASMPRYRQHTALSPASLAASAGCTAADTGSHKAAVSTAGCAVAHGPGDASTQGHKDAATA